MPQNKKSPNSKKIIGENLQKEMQELVVLIQKYDKHYYELSQPLVSDLDYDKLYERLKYLEKELALFNLSNSPTQKALVLDPDGDKSPLPKKSLTEKLGSDLQAQFEEVVHIQPLKSLNKVYQVQDIEKWAQKYSQPLTSLKKDAPFLSVEPKIDGFSVVLHYEKGVLVQALSRGDGEKGNNLTQNIKTIKNIPLKIASQKNIVVRGEVFISKKNFEIVNEKEGNIYTNPRNFAAGVIRRIDIQAVKNIPLEIFVYDAFFSDPKENFSSHSEMLFFLKSQGFPLSPCIIFLENPLLSQDSTLPPQIDEAPIEPDTSPSLFSDILVDKTFNKTSAHSQQSDFYPNQSNLWVDLETYPFQKISDFVTHLNNLRKSLPFEIDGLVFKLNDKNLQKHLGTTQHHPRWAMALKFESPSSVSIVRDITLQVGRTGKITPLASLDPVFIDGSTVTKATLHNQDYINSLGLDIGYTVEISKRGDVIPAVEKVIQHGDKNQDSIYTIPLECPSCKGILVQKSAHLFCENPECSGKKIQQLLYFTKSLDMENFGIALIEEIYHYFNVKDIPSLFLFDYNNLLKVEGFGEKKIVHLKTVLNKTPDKTSFLTLLKALGIPKISGNIISLLWKNGYHSLEKLTTLAENENIQNEENLSKITGIGDVAIQNIKSAFAKNSLYTKILLQLKDIGFTLEEPPFQGALESASTNQWVITGSFQHFANRQEIIHKIEQNNGRQTSQLSKNTNYLLVGEKPGSKLAKAEKLGVKIISEQEFLEMFPDK